MVIILLGYVYLVTTCVLLWSAHCFVIDEGSHGWGSSEGPFFDPHSPATASREEIDSVNLHMDNPKAKPGYQGASSFIGKDFGDIMEVIYDDPLPPKAIHIEPEETALVFVSIASFRDKLCPQTLFRMFTKAKYPERLRVGLVQQNDDDDVDCVEIYCNMMTNLSSDTSSQYSQKKEGEEGVKIDPHCKHLDQIQVKRFHARNAKGPVWARAKTKELLGNEDYCMQIDSHMDFVYNWDHKMTKMWEMIDNEYAVLSTYVAQNTPKIKGINDYVDDDDTDTSRTAKTENQVPHLCMVTLYDMPRNWGTKALKNFKHPKLTNGIWGAGLSFSKCHAERKSPYDPYISHVFDGEEFSKAARLWTHGYDIYTPHKVFISHEYTESQADRKHSTWSQHINRDELQYSHDRIRALLDLPNSGYSDIEKARLRRSKYGLGDRRSLTQFLLFSGVNTTFKDSFHMNRCGNIHYVPFTEHTSGANYELKYDLKGNSDLGEMSRNLGIFPFKDTVDLGSIYYKHQNKHHLDSNSNVENEGGHDSNSNIYSKNTNGNADISSQIGLGRGRSKGGRAPRPKVLVGAGSPSRLRFQRAGRCFIFFMLIAVAMYTVATLPQRALNPTVVYFFMSLYRSICSYIFSLHNFIYKYTDLLLVKLGSGSSGVSSSGHHTPNSHKDNNNTSNVKDV